MNKQGPNGIEWTDYTWNVVSGCRHACRWDMPDGTTAKCYAETVAEGVAQAAYPQGFAHHYYHPERLSEPLKLKQPAKIFLDSMSDLMGHWVPDEQIQAVLDVCREAHWHTFQLLTKNPPHLRKFEFPPNVWVGASVPPSHMMGKPLTYHQQREMLYKAIKDLDTYARDSVKWLSIEPLSFDVAEIIKGFGRYLNLQWAVIGAASTGRKYYQPEPRWVEDLLNVLDKNRVPVFFKGNLDWSPWRNEFPSPPKPRQMGLFEAL